MSKTTWGHGGAVFSPCERWRYTLERCWTLGAPLRTVCFVGLNPSTATAEVDDATMRRCVGFAKSWDFDRFVMLNLFAFRSTDPRALYGLSPADAIGPDNDEHIERESAAADLVVAAWGNHGTLHGRGESVAKAVLRARPERLGLHAMRVTRAGQPNHPLYLPSNLTPAPWTPWPR